MSFRQSGAQKRNVPKNYGEIVEMVGHLFRQWPVAFGFVTGGVAMDLNGHSERYLTGSDSVEDMSRNQDD
jgi:hypothetical protein